MISILSYYDHQLFQWIQLNLHGSFLDTIIILSRDKFFWIPMYLALISWMYNFHKRHFWLIVGCTILLIALTDQLNSNFLKKKYKRTRPCRELYFSNQFQASINCSGGYSFPSSHAANHAAIGIFYTLILSSSVSRWRYLLLLWAPFIGFAQVFVGVHFPIDILCGLLVGSFTGLLVFLIFRSISNKIWKQ